MTIDELIEAARASADNRAEMILEGQLFSAVFYIERPTLYIERKRVSLGVARMGLLTLERRTGKTATLCAGPVIRLVDDLVTLARLNGKWEATIGGAKFEAIGNDGNMHFRFNGERMNRKKIEPVFEARLRIQRSMDLCK